MTIRRTVLFLALALLLAACGGIRREAMKYARYGYIDRAGTLAIPGGFEEAGDFHDGLALFYMTPLP